MRVTFVLPTANLSGGARVVGIYAQQLMRLGHTVCLISQPRIAKTIFQKLSSWSKGDGLPVQIAHSQSHFEGRGLDHRVLSQSRPVVDDDVPDADIVVATWWETAEWVNALGPEKGTKVYFVQGHEVFSYLPIERCRATYRLPLHKIVVSKWLRDIMLQEYDDAVVDLVPNSVDHSQFFAAKRGKQSVPTVGCLYSSVPFKGFEIILAALGKVRERFPEVRVISFGTQRVRAGIRLPAGTEFFLSPPQQELKNLYSSCDVWVSASVSEGFNLPAMEAMACRTPVVAARTGWPEEAIKTGCNGVLVEIGDALALARGIGWVLSLNDEKWRTLSANAYETVEKSSWKESAKMFEAALMHASRRAARGEVGGNCKLFSR
jgi:glycosyltransferase involved in cell wall biosynthesis